MAEFVNVVMVSCIGLFRAWCGTAVGWAVYPGYRPLLTAKAKMTHSTRSRLNTNRLLRVCFPGRLPCALLWQYCTCIFNEHSVTRYLRCVC